MCDLLSVIGKLASSPMEGMYNQTVTETESHFLLYCD